MRKMCVMLFCFYFELSFTSNVKKNFKWFKTVLTKSSIIFLSVCNICFPHVFLKKSIKRVEF